MSRSVKQRSCEVDEPSSSMYVASRSFIAGEFSLNFKRNVERIQIAACYRFESIPAAARSPTFPLPLPLFSMGYKSLLAVCRCRCSCKSRLYKLIPRGVTVASRRITNGPSPVRTVQLVTFYFRVELASRQARGPRKYAIMSRMMHYIAQVRRDD